MATTRRRKSLAVIQQLLNEPYRYEFLQAVRLLEMAAQAESARDNGIAWQPVAGAVPPNHELVRFKSRATLNFRAADVIGIEQEATLDGGDASAPQSQWHMQVGFMGLAGSQGVLPFYFSEAILKLQRENNETLKDFLDIINHRTVSLFYQAGRKYQLPLDYERHKRQNERRPDLFSHALSALAGLGTQHLGNRLSVPDEALYGFSGLLSRPVRSASGLKGLVQHYFGIRVSIEQFCPQWQELPDDVVTRMPDARGHGGRSRHPASHDTDTSLYGGLNNILGGNALLGVKCRNVQSKFRIKLEPMSYERFMTLAPGSEKLEALQSLIQYYAGTELDYEICVSILDAEIPPTQLRKDEPPLLGWNTHSASTKQNTSMVEIKVSKHIASPEEELPMAV